MSDQLELLEHDRREREFWLGSASRVLYASCRRCRRVHSDDDRPLLVARQPRARRRLCFTCWLETRRRR